jgi:hypothetical protein
LAGTGKPLNYDYTRENPYVDTHTHKLNEILKNNGYTPEWAAMDREIRHDIRELRSRLRNTTEPTNELALREEIERINKRIDRYNLIAPALHMQMFHLNVDRELRRASEL